MCGRCAVMCGLEGQAVVEDGGEGDGWDQEQNAVGDKVFHGLCGVQRGPDRSGWVNGSGHPQGVNP